MLKLNESKANLLIDFPQWPKIISDETESIAGTDVKKFPSFWSFEKLNVGKQMC